MNRLEGTVVDALTRRILESAFEVHAQLGPGLLENVYAVCLAAELRSNGLEVATEVPIPVSYKNIQLEAAYRADLLVEKAGARGAQVDKSNTAGA